MGEMEGVVGYPVDQVVRNHHNSLVYLSGKNCVKIVPKDRMVEYHHEVTMMNWLNSRGVSWCPVVLDANLLPGRGGYLVMPKYPICLMDWCIQPSSPNSQDNQGRIKQARIYLTQLGQIIEELHGLGIYHRDIKPENLMVNDLGQLILIDYSYAGFSETRELRARGVDLTYYTFRMGVVTGTPHYISARIFQRTETDYRNQDVFAVGICFYILAVGEYYYLAATLPELVQRVIGHQFNPKVGALDDRDLKLIQDITHPDSSLTIIDVNQRHQANELARQFPQE